MPLPASATSALPVSAPCAAREGKMLGLDELLPGGSSRVRYLTAALGGALWWGDCLVLSSEEDFCRKAVADCVKSASPFGEKCRDFLPEGEALLAFDAAAGNWQYLFSFEQLNRFLTDAGLNKVYTLERLSFPLPGKPVIQVYLPGQGYVWIDFSRWRLERKILLPPDAACADVSPNLQAVAYTVGNNLFVSTASGAQQVTDEPEGVLCGQKVHREEWGIAKGTFWSPGGQLLAFYRMDERMVEQHYLVEAEAMAAERPAVRYPMAGRESHQVTIGIYDPAARTTVFLQTGSPVDRYFTNISWSPDGQKLYIIELNRTQTRAELCRYDAHTGQREGVVVAEENEKYVQPLHPVAFLPWQEDAFLYRSRRDGFDHFYLYRTDGTQLLQVTQGAWLVGDLLGFDAETQELTFTSNQASPLQQHVYRLQLSVSGGTVGAYSLRRCSLYPDGWQEGELSPSRRFLLSRHQSHDMPGEVDVMDCRDGRQVAHLLSASDPYSGCRMPSIELGVLPAADETTPLYYRMLKPADFDAARLYPVILYVYGGPGIRLISDRWQYEARGWDIYMANRGYIVFTLDSRGSRGRDFSFESATSRRLGVEEEKDQMCGVRFLQSLPFVDNRRIGVHGWSYGGHMTVALMLRYPEVFCAGVAGGAVIDWRYYEVMYGERYMKTPAENTEGYAATDLKQLVGRLKGALLLIHGGQDSVVLPVHVFSFLQAAVEAGVQPDFFLYPTYGHHVTGHDRIHLYEKITRYFDTHLKCPGSGGQHDIEEQKNAYEL
jgi:dipeptidyl-peptidase-4